MVFNPKPQLVWSGNGHRVVCTWSSYTYRQYRDRSNKFGLFVTQPGEHPTIFKRCLCVEKQEGTDSLGNDQWQKIDTTTAHLIEQLAGAIADFKNIPKEITI